MAANFDKTDIMRTWQIFRQPGEVLELRIPKAGRYKIISGYFDDPAKLADAVIGLADEKFAGIYFTVNPVRPDLLARAANRYAKYAETTTSDADITELHWLPVDLDAKRPAGISSTDGEHVAAITKAREIRRWLIEEQHWPAGAFVLADSGNGSHLNVKIDLPHLSENVAVVRGCLEALDFLFSDEKITVDTTSQNPARIWKIYGTMARKGDSTAERPHRLARLLDVPEAMEIVTKAQLEALAAMLPRREEQQKTSGKCFDPVAYCQAHNLQVHHTKPWTDRAGAKCTVAVLEQCVFNPDHHKSAVIIGWPNGMRSYRCRHNSCLDKHWADAKAIIEPGSTNNAHQQTDDAGSAEEEPKGPTAAREDAGSINSEQREIIVTNRHMQDITAESLPELVAYNNPPRIFVKAGYLVQIAVDEKEITRIELLSESALKSRLSRCARYMRIASEDGELAATDAPGKVVKDMLALPNWPGILPIVGLISSPVVRPDGTIIDQPGHDAVTGLFYTGNVGMSLNVPDTPTQEDAVKAAAYILTEVFGDFPFKEQASRANTLAALLTTLTLPLIGDNIPLGLFDKPQAGTGASLLTEIIAELVTGEKANMQTAPDNDEEWRKAITAVLIQGPQIVVIDNVTSTLKSSKLSQMLTARTWSDRMLGQTKMLNLPQTAAWFATGNNVQVGGDIGRRSYWIRVDALLARPWLRDGFRHQDILAWVEEHRSELLSMLLTMVRAWIVAGRPNGIAPKIGSFVKWSQVIGGILTYAGVEGFLGNAAELYDSADQDIAQWDLFLDEWQKLHRDDKITSGMLKTELTDNQPVYKPFQNEMPEEIIKAIDKGTRGAVGLGKALSRHADQVFPSGRKLTVEVDSHTKGKKWSVTTIKRSAVDENGPEPQPCDPFAVDAVVGLTPSPNQKGNSSGIEEREEKSGIIPERNGGRGGSTTASTAKRPDDIENGILPSTANRNGNGSSPAPKDDPGFQKFRTGMKKRLCLMCGEHFSYDLGIQWQDGYICARCHREGPPPAPVKPDSQTTLGKDEAKA